MHILYLASIRLPTEKAHGLQIMKTCEALAHAGAEVELCVPTRKSSITADPFDYYYAQKNFTLKKLASPDWVGLGTIGFLLTTILFAEVAKWQKEFWKADVIYSRDALVLLQYVLLGRTLVFEVHRKPTWTDGMVARVAYRVVAINAAIRDALVRGGVAASKIIIAHDAVELRIPQGTREELNMEGSIVAYAGSTQPGKGAEILLAAEPKLNAKLMLIRNLPPIEARQFLNNADVVVVPNSAKSERWSTYTSPMKLFEALASGAAVVASDVPALREVVDEQSVYFFKPDDAADLVRAVQRALTDPQRSEKIAAARSLAEKYSWDARARTILAAL